MAFGIEKINWEKIKSFTGNAIVGAMLYKHCRLQLVGLGFGEHGKPKGETNV